MITEKDIKTRIVEILGENGFNAVPPDVREGFKKPAVFVTVFPSSITLDGAYMEHIIDTVEIKYVPAVETTEECGAAAQRLRHILMYKPLDVGDRHLTIEAIEFDIEDYILYANFELEYYQETPENEEYEEMRDLQIRGGNF